MRRSRSAATRPSEGRIAMSRSVDVCVVGAGVAGAATALRLARHGVRVALIGEGSDSLRRPGDGQLGEPRLPTGPVGAARTASHTAEVLPPSAVHALTALGVD